MRYLPLLLLVSCAHVPPAPPPAPWLELRSPHFALMTDLPAEQARRSLIDLELYRTAIAEGLGSTAESPLQATVVLASRVSYLGELGWPSNVFGGTQQDGADVILAMAADSSEDGGRETQLHELTHLLASQRWSRLPKWLSEGLAAYFGATELTADRKEAELGCAPSRHWPQAWEVHLSLSQLWRWDVHEGSGLEELVRYASASLWTHFLFDVHGVSFQSYLDRMARGEPETEAWLAAFAGVGMEQLEAELIRYRAAGQLQRRRVPLQEGRWPLKERRVTNPELHLLRARLVWPGRNARAMLLREAAAARREDPASYEALIIEVRAASAPELPALVARAKALPSDSAPVWKALAAHATLLDGPLLQEVADRASRLLPDDPVVLTAQALALLRANQPAEAAQRAARALELAPTYLLGTLAASDIAWRQRDCPRAISLLERVLWAIPHTQDDVQAKLISALERRRVACEAN